MRTNMAKSFFIAFFLLTFIAAGVSSGQEPLELYFRTKEAFLSPASEFSVEVIVAGNQPINALDLEVSYPVDLLEFLGFDNSESIVDIWQGNPEAKIDGLIVLRGGLFRPFEGGEGELIKLNFRSQAVGQGQIIFKKGNFFLADGKGTLIIPVIRPLEILISEQAPLAKIEKKPDQTPPRLNVEIAKTPLEKSQLIVFSAQDKESGIKSAVFRSKKWFTWSDWQNTQNPFPVPKGAWTIELKVVNNNGDETIKVIYLWGEIVLKIVLLLGGLFLLIAASRFLFYNKNK